MALLSCRIVGDPVQLFPQGLNAEGSPVEQGAADPSELLHIQLFLLRCDMGSHRLWLILHFAGVISIGMDNIHPMVAVEQAGADDLGPHDIKSCILRKAFLYVCINGLSVNIDRSRRLQPRLLQTRYLSGTRRKQRILEHKRIIGVQSILRSLGISRDIRYILVCKAEHGIQNRQVDHGSRRYGAFCGHRLVQQEFIVFFPAAMKRKQIFRHGSGRCKHGVERDIILLQIHRNGGNCRREKIITGICNGTGLGGGVSPAVILRILILLHSEGLSQNGALDHLFCIQRIAHIHRRRIKCVHQIIDLVQILLADGVVWIPKGCCQLLHLFMDIRSPFRRCIAFDAQKGNHGDKVAGIYVPAIMI